jgi:hypothetical protein
MKARYTVQLRDWYEPRWYSWEFNLSYDAAKAAVAHAKECGEKARIIPFDAKPTVADLL